MTALPDARPPADPEKLFTEIFEAHHRTVHAYLVGRAGEPEAARDLLQETFLRVWRRLDDVGVLPASRRQAWIFTVARNLVTDTYRERATRATTARALAELADPVARPADQPEATVERRELVNDVAAAVRALPEDLRVILALHAAGELTSARIGEVLGIPAGTVRYKLARARRRLAETLRIGPLPHPDPAGHTHPDPPRHTTGTNDREAR